MEQKMKAGREKKLKRKEDCSAGACERNWSAYSLIHTKIRNRLSTAQLERLVFCRANLRLFRNFSSLAGPKQELAKKKMVEEVVKAAYAKKDHLLDFPPFQKYDRNGIAVRLETAYGDGLSSPLKEYIVQLLKINMEGPYGPEWSVEEKVKRREMVDPQARYLIVRKENFNDEDKRLWKENGDPVVGFVQYRFVIEEELPVQYVYELQLEKPIQGRGLGKFLMQLLELIARKNNMKAVMLTVQKRNTDAFGFYTSRMRYNISSISPSRVDPMIDSTYEILCKTFEPEAKSKLEDINDTELGH